VIGFAARLAIILAVFCSIGLQWATLQSIAWTTMLIRYSREVPLRHALARTLDGAHPCSLCHAVSSGKNSEKKSDVQSPKSKIDIILSTRIPSLQPGFAIFDYPRVALAPVLTGQPPPVPPPRPRIS
jgi:hypothetical protein